MRICALFLLVIMPIFAHAQDFRSTLLLSPYSLSAGDILVGKASDPQPVTLVNTGPNAVHIVSIAITGNFIQTNDCPLPPAGLKQNDTCMIQITFKPNAVGKASGTLTIEDDLPGGVLVANLSGSGTLEMPAVGLSPMSLSFSEQAQGNMSPPQTVTLTNSGKRVLSISSLTVNGDFTIIPISTCEHLSGPLAPGASCTVVVTFTPLQAGKRDGQMAIMDDAEDSPQKVVLSGTGK